MAIVIPVVKGAECGTCFFYRGKSKAFGICKFTGPDVVKTTSRHEVCGQHHGVQFRLPGINPTPLQKGDQP